MCVRLFQANGEKAGKRLLQNSQQFGHAPLTRAKNLYSRNSVRNSLVDIVVDQAGFRSKKFTIATTITDIKLYSRDWIGSVYRSRWLVELDIRSIKCSLGMDEIRAKSPEMVRTEIWSCLLAYNLIRLKMLQGAALCGRMPRSLSFTATLQSLGNTWLLAAVNCTPELVQLGISLSSSQTVGNRPDRVEPRANKRRHKVIALLTKPRNVIKAELTVAA